VTEASTLAERWERIAHAPPAEVSLAEGALLIAAEDCRDLDVADYLDRIGQMAATLAKRLRSDISTTDALLALNHYLFDELGFRGNHDDYYDPRNSYLNEVIERRLGIPITLAVLYIDIGRRIGLPLDGVSFPAHFLVRCTLRDGAIVLDPYAGGVSLGLDDLRSRLAGMGAEEEVAAETIAHLLSAAAPREVFARMLRNLRAIHLTHGDRLKALSATDRIISLMPQAAAEYRERAELYRHLECFRAALADFVTYLRLSPGASDAEEIRHHIADLEPLAARIN
jgi:regulator of sirC expression with transglutaminase-like and TPR domain